MTTQQLAKVAWSEPFIGKSQYVMASDRMEFKPIKNFEADSGFVVIQPDKFGLTGEVISVIDANANANELKGALAQALAKHQPSQLTYEEHRQQGARAGARWESKTPNQEQGSRRGGRRPGR